jgi:hypothetical protein
MKAPSTLKGDANNEAQSVGLSGLKKDILLGLCVRNILLFFAILDLYTEKTTCCGYMLSVAWCPLFLDW